ncbi:hypothetical protein NDU88_001611 [Pleurodeles waltl]|uniref:Uncharacterized protein n=1 Tax=Pleurodeles waltl TaxID=8319 RepID=A0AAV7LD39_PLEWA|nr:hypothetical protein NDU88_001611 [Pleurodeles waltl]
MQHQILFLGRVAARAEWRRTAHRATGEPPVAKASGGPERGFLTLEAGTGPGPRTLVSGKDRINNMSRNKLQKLLRERRKGEYASLRLSDIVRPTGNASTRLDK